MKSFPFGYQIYLFLTSERQAETEKDNGNEENTSQAK